METSTPGIDESVFQSNSNWVEFYEDVEEEDPPQMPEPLGEPVLTSTFVDFNNALNVVTRRSNTGIILFVCNGIIKDFLKRHNTVE